MKQDLNNLTLNRDDIGNLWRLELSSNEHGYNFIDLGSGRSQRSAVYFAKRRLSSLLKCVCEMEESIKRR